ncbi:MAG: hypothetical protein AB7J28_12485 [Hyphomonadaceae bacterium]
MRLRPIFSVLVCSVFLGFAATAQPSGSGAISSDVSFPGFMSRAAPERAFGEAQPPATQQTAQEICCPAGYPWLRQSTNTCYATHAECRDTNGGGWSCRQVNAC